MTRWTALVLGLVAASAAAQPARPNAVLLVASPALTDPNFREAVVLVTQAPDASTVGVILNRPLTRALSDFLREGEAAGKYRQPVFAGGPVMRNVLVAVSRTARPPDAPAFALLEGIYLTMHPENIKALLAGGGDRYRLYAGFSGWAPGQLAGELQRGGWHVLPAREDLLFREDTGTLWSELAQQARGGRVRAPRNSGAENVDSGGAARRTKAIYSNP